MYSPESRHQRNRRPESWGATIGGVFAVIAATGLFVAAVVASLAQYAEQVTR